MIDTILEQRIIIKFLVKLKKTSTESYKLLQDVYGESVLSKERVFEWHQQFTEGREDAYDDTRPGRPTTAKSDENVERVREFVCSNRRITTRMIADKLSLSKESVRRILTVDLQMKKIVPTNISSGEKANNSGVDWSTEETRRPEEVGDSVTSTSAEDGKPIQKKSADTQSNVVFFQEHFGSKVSEQDGELSEDSEVGEWDYAGHLEASSESVEHPAPREDHMLHAVVVKQEIMEEEDDFIRNEDFNTLADENGGYEGNKEPPWENPSLSDNIASAVRMENNPLSQTIPEGISSGEIINGSGVDWNGKETSEAEEEPLGSNAADPDGEGSEGSDVGEWDDTEQGETAAKSTEHPVSREEHAVQEVIVKQEVMDEEEEYMMDESFNSAADENGEFEETEEPPWDKSPSLDDIPAAAEMEEVTASNPVAYDELQTTNTSNRRRKSRQHICPYCKQSFLKQRQLYGHMAMHSRKGNYSKATTNRERSATYHNRPMAKVRTWLQGEQAQMKFTCIDCYEEFVGVGTFTSHKGIHRKKDKKFHCSVCNHVYPRAIDLIFHEWTYHTGDRPFPCDRCPSAFARQTSWTYHILAHINNGARFPSGRMRINPSNKPQISPSPESPSKSEMVTRRTVAPRRAAIEGRAASQMGAAAASLGAYPFKCRTCGKGILNEESWEYHLVVHPDGGETRQKLSPEELESLRAQLRSILTCENKAKIACLQCGVEIVGILALANHKAEHHLTKAGYRCTVCFKGVENVHKFIRHEMSHTKVKIYLCELCGREMADRMSFIHHIIAHFNENQFEPQPIVAKNAQPVVGMEGLKREEGKERSFDQLVQRLLVPIKAHLKQELVPCLQCGQVFEGIQRLVTHKETHSGNPAVSHPHACWVCGDAFESAKALVEHEWIHTDMKPYECDKCDQKFSSKIAWVNHLQGHFLEETRSRPN